MFSPLFSHEADQIAPNQLSRADKIGPNKGAAKAMTGSGVFRIRTAKKAITIRNSWFIIVMGKFTKPSTRRITEDCTVFEGYFGDWKYP